MKLKFSWGLQILQYIFLTIVLFTMYFYQKINLEYKSKLDENGDVIKKATMS